MKLLHLADLHWERESRELVEASLMVALDAAQRERIDAWALAGDMFGRSIRNSDADGFPRLVNIVQQMLEVAPILSVEGTGTHDAPGCYRIFEELKAAHRFYNLRPDQPQIVAGALFLGLPELTKEWILAGANGLSKDEADQKVLDEVRKILLGMGAIRVEHPEIPCVLVAHVGIAGAKMQPTQIATGGIMLGREDLALVGFDYAALGHFHLEQQIDGLPAFYSGPAFHTDWNHLGRCGCNLVEIADQRESGDPGPIYCPVVTRIPFPHPARRKIEASWGDDLTPYMPVDQQLWLALRAPAEHCTNEDRDIVLSKIMALGALEGSRVTLDAIPTETVRAAEITEKHHLRDKLLVNAEASDELPPAESVLAKADALEQEATAAQGETGAHLRIRKLRLRGATGIWKGLGVDEVTLDLDVYDAGLIALIGPNGAGKSTLLENMHPWPQLLTRDGKLQDHFRLRDSARELWFVDERAGVEYRALMLVDGVNATGKAEFHLFHAFPGEDENSGGWEPLTNGRREDYEAAIERLFGTLALFLRSAFVSQRATKNNPDLAEATKGEKKAIFRELAGLDYLQAAAESAKGKGAAIEQETALAEAGVAAKREALSALPELQQRMDAGTVDLAKKTMDLSVIEQDGKAAASRAKELQAALEQQRAAEKQIAEEERAAAVALDESAKAHGEIETLQSAIAAKPAAEKSLTEYEQLREEERGESEKARQHAQDVARVQSQYANDLRAHRDHETEIDRRHTIAQKAMVTLEGDRRVVLGQIDRLIADIATPEKACVNCGYIDPERQKVRAGWQTSLAVDQARAHELAQDIEERFREVEAIEDESTDPPEAPKPPAFDDTRLRELRSGMSRIDVSALRRIVEAARTAEVRIGQLTQIHADRTAQAANATSCAEKLRAGIDAALPARAASAAADHEATRQRYITANGECVGLRSTIKAARDRITELERQQAEIEEVTRTIVIRRAEAAEWRWLQNACGPDGVQALELDAIAPSLTVVASEILGAAREVYPWDEKEKKGIPYDAVKIETTRIAGRGGKTKQVEDFEIYLHDTRVDDWTKYGWVSGGEHVWGTFAIYSAFSVIRARSAQKFATLFSDEADGALDVDAKLAYVRMIETAYRASGCHQMILITHSPEIQEMVPQRIVMRELAGKAVPA